MAAEQHNDRSNKPKQSERGRCDNEDVPCSLSCLKAAVPLTAAASRCLGARGAPALRLLPGPEEHVVVPGAPAARGLRWTGQARARRCDGRVHRLC